MEKYIYDKANGWWYALVDEYYLPCVHSEDPTTKPDCHIPDTDAELQPTVTCDNRHLTYLCKNSITSDALTEDNPSSTWGNRHLTYLRKHRPTVYREFLRSGTLNSYLAETNRNAQELFDRLVIQLTKSQGITEELKAKDQMEWVRSMNAIHHAAKEIVLTEVIYA